MITPVCRSRFSISMVGLTLLLISCRRVAEADHPKPQGSGVDYGRGRRRLRHLCRHRRRPGLCAGVVLWYDVQRRACDAMTAAFAAFMALALSPGTRRNVWPLPVQPSADSTPPRLPLPCLCLKSVPSTAPVGRLLYLHEKGPLDTAVVSCRSWAATASKYSECQTVCDL